MEVEDLPHVAERNEVLWILQLVQEQGDVVRVRKRLLIRVVLESFLRNQVVGDEVVQLLADGGDCHAAVTCGALHHREEVGKVCLERLDAQLAAEVSLSRLDQVTGVLVKKDPVGQLAAFGEEGLLGVDGGILSLQPLPEPSPRIVKRINCRLNEWPLCHDVVLLRLLLEFLRRQLGLACELVVMPLVRSRLLLAP